MKAKITFLQLSVMFFTLAFCTTNAQTPILHYNFENSLENSGSLGNTFDLAIDTKAPPSAAVNYSTGKLGTGSYKLPDANNVKNFLSSNSDPEDASGFIGISGNAARTITAWVKKPNNGVNFNVVCLGATNKDRQMYGLRFLGTGRLRVEYGGTGIYGDPMLTDNVLPFDTWVHIAITMPTGGTTQQTTVYVNGEVYPTISQNGDDLSVQTINRRVLIGVQVNVYNKGVAGPPTANPGEVDDVRIFDTNLTQAQIQAIMAEAPLSVADQEFAANELSIYPNAVTDYLNIESTVANTFQVSVFDMLGKQVSKATVTGKLNMGNLSSGLYIVKIRSGNKASSFKVVKK